MVYISKKQQEQPAPMDKTGKGIKTYLVQSALYKLNFAMRFFTLILTELKRY
jgi:hypothetical protein